ncbi:MAG TPA: class I SAM-dependent methyltransferase, partial [Ignavibacteria bacterium]|nr:class I SAM-dependent methyltransferase [Ignavibacteria bacterium]
KDNPDLDITILNLNEPRYSQNGNLRFVKGDVTDLSEFADKSFDVVFSNSVIEHIPKSRDRQKMANEIRRVGRRSFVQTPNYYFPFEPHFLFPCFQFFPEALKLFLLQKFNMGWFKKCENRKQAQKLLEENSLLNLHEFREYFNRSRIIKEKFLFLSKSYIAVNT